MTKIILYPTDTLYGLGVQANDLKAQEDLALLKGRDHTKTTTWLVRSIADIERYAVLNSVARMLAEQFLPGPLTLILKTHSNVPNAITAPDGTVGFRITADPVATKLIADYMAEHNAPLTATSANVGGEPSLATPREILAQFGERASQITDVIDDGPRTGPASTLVRIIDGEVTVLREGAVAEAEIRRVLNA